MVLSIIPDLELRTIGKNIGCHHARPFLQLTLHKAQSVNGFLYSSPFNPEDTGCMPRW